MASTCELTGKRSMSGNRVSDSLQRTKRRFRVNIQKTTLVIDGQKVTMNLSTRAIRILRKKGVIPATKRSQAAAK